MPRPPRPRAAVLLGRPRAAVLLARPRAPMLLGTTALATALTLGATACGTASDDTLAGFGLPTASAEDLDALPRPPVPVEGTLRVAANGCFLWADEDGTERWVLWPPGAEHDDDHVRLADGTRVGEGAELRGTGVTADAAELPTWQETDGYLHSFGTYCAADESGVLVLDDVAPAS